MYRAPTPPAPLTQVGQHLEEARSTCRELMQVLNTESSNMADRRIEVLEDRLQLKRHLSLRLERLVQGLKSMKDQWEGDARSAETARLLASEMGEFQRVAARNMMQLKAAHQIRADVISLLKDTFENQQAPLGYAKDGSLKRGNAGTVMRKEI